MDNTSLTKRIMVWVVASFVLLTTAPGLSAKELTHSMSGYYKNLAVQGNTFIGNSADYFLDLNRLRLQLDAAYQALSMNIKYDNEWLLGDYLRTMQYQLLGQPNHVQYWNLDKRYINRPSLQARQKLYRGTLSWHGEQTDVRVGRQQINWSTTIIWNPMDRFNPLNPLQLERNERLGVDALKVDYALGDTSSLSVAYAPAHDVKKRLYAARIRTNWLGIDGSIMAGDYARVQKFGLGLAGQLNWVGWRSEIVASQPQYQKAYTEVVVSVDYTTLSGISLLLEGYYNGEGTTDKKYYPFNRLIQGTIVGVGKHYWGGKVSKDLSPLLRLSLYAIQNLDDGSRFFYPTINYTVPQFRNLYFKAGAQVFNGSAGSEYHFLKSLYFVSLQQYF